MAGNLFYIGEQRSSVLLYDVQVNDRSVIVTSYEEALPLNALSSPATPDKKTISLEYKNADVPEMSFMGPAGIVYGTKPLITSTAPAAEDRFLVGAVTGLPVARNVSASSRKPYDSFHDAHPISIRYRQRVPVKGESLDPKFAGRLFVPLSSSLLSMDDPTFSSANWYGSIITIATDDEGVLHAPSAFGNLADSQYIPTGRLLECFGYRGTMVFVARENMKSISDGHLALLCTSDDVSFISNRKDWKKENDRAKLMTKLRDQLPTIEISGPSRLRGDEKTELSIEVRHRATGTKVGYNGVLRISPISGYFPKTNIQVNDGKAKFPVHALGLESGDEVHFWLGVNTNDGISEHKIKVV